MHDFHDPYRMLGVRQAATLTEIKAAHRRLAKRYHPDAPEGDTDRFVAVQRAFELLSDPLRRREWDTRHGPGPIRAGETGDRGRARRSGAGRRDGNAAWGQAHRASDDATGERGSRHAGADPREARPGTGHWSAAEPDHDTRRGPRPTAGNPRGPANAPPGGAPSGWSASGRDASRRSYTWSATGVPWWDDAEKVRAAREEAAGQQGARGPASRQTGTSAGGSRATWSRTEPSAESGTADKGPAGSDTSTRGTAEGPQPGASDFDVYSRSSGAAWSAAARAYFRRAEADLPRGGSSPGRPRWGLGARGPVGRGHHGDGPGPGATDGARTGPGGTRPRDARGGAAERGARRAGDADGPARRERGEHPADAPPVPGSRPGPGGPARPPETQSSSTAGNESRPSGRAAPRSGAAFGGREGATGTTGSAAASGPWRAAPAAGTHGGRAAAGLGAPYTPRAATDAWYRSTPHIWPEAGTTTAPHTFPLRRARAWPSVVERVLYATLAWLPLALAIAYGGGAVTGCDRAATSCSALVEPIQLLLMGAVLGALALLPRVAYLAAAGTIAFAVASLAVVLVYSLIQVPQPVPQPFLVIALLVWLCAYLGGWYGAAHDVPIVRPWLRSRAP